MTSFPAGLLFSRQTKKSFFLFLLESGEIIDFHPFGTQEKKNGCDKRTAAGIYYYPGQVPDFLDRQGQTKKDREKTATV